MKLIFGGEGEGWQLMQILAIAAIFIIIAQTSTSILNGVGHVMLPVYTILVGCIIKVGFSLRFIPEASLNIRAAAYGTLLAYGVVAFIDMLFVVKSTRVRIKIIDAFVSPAFCTVGMIFSVILSYTYIENYSGSNTISVLSSIVLGMVIYVALLNVTKTLRFDDMKRLITKQ